MYIRIGVFIVSTDHVSIISLLSVLLVVLRLVVVTTLSSVALS